jgi:hypothetical protein
MTNERTTYLCILWRLSGSLLEGGISGNCAGWERMGGVIGVFFLFLFLALPGHDFSTTPSTL